SRSWSRDAGARFVAVGAACFDGVEEDQRVPCQTLDDHIDHRAGWDEASMAMPDTALPLIAIRPQPGVRESKQRAAVVVLLVLDAHGAAVAFDDAGSLDTVGNSGDDLGEMDRSVRVVSN